MSIPEREQQIVQAHAGLIVRVVMAVQSREHRQDLEQVLKVSEQNGWGHLVAAVRHILAGRRDEAVLLGLDEEDTAIVRAVLRGLQDPSTLPDPNLKPDPALAAPGLASMVHAAAHGDVAALQALANMAEQMSKAGGDMARLGGVLRPLINGERDPDRLTRGMSTEGRTLVLSILGELGRLTAH